MIVPRSLSPSPLIRWKPVRWRIEQMLKTNLHALNFVHTSIQTTARPETQPAIPVQRFDREQQLPMYPYFHHLGTS